MKVGVALTTHNITRMDAWIFYFLAGYALFSSLSVAIGNIFLGLALAVFLLRMACYRGDLVGRLTYFRGFFRVVSLMLAIALLSAAFSEDFFVGGKVFLNYYIYRLMGMVLIILFVRSKKRLLVLLGLVLVSFLINDINCVRQGIYGLAPRPDGFIPYMTFGGILSMLIPIILLLSIRLTGFWRLGMTVLLFLSLAAGILNSTRGMWLSVAITAPVAAFLIVQDKKKFLVGGITMLLTFYGLFQYVPVFQQRIVSVWQMDYQSNAERLLIWHSSWNMFVDHPVLGVGFGQYEHAYQTKYILPEAKERSLGHAHSNVMQMLGERGILGEAAFLIMWLYFMYFGLRGWWRTKNPAYLAFFSVVLGLMLQGLTEYNMGNSVVTKLFWFLLGLCLQWIRISEEEKIV